MKREIWDERNYVLKREDLREKKGKKWRNYVSSEENEELKKLETASIKE